MIYLAETAVAAVASHLASYLSTELAAIDAAKADGITLSVPEATDIISYAVDTWPMPRPILIEVFADASEFSDWGAAEIGANRISAQHEITVRTSIADPTMKDPAELYTRSYRTVAAIVRVLSIEHFDLSATSGIQVCTPGRIEYRTLGGDVAVRQATQRFTVETYEVNS